VRRMGQVQRGRAVNLLVNGHPVEAYEGETVAAALHASGVIALRRTAVRGEPRGLFCGMGVCFECLMQIDGRPNQQACLTLVRDNMQVRVQEPEVKCHHSR
jgi:predicted molibdopterin-dependent oxidoreductase YjgC